MKSVEYILSCYENTDYKFFMMNGKIMNSNYNVSIIQLIFLIYTENENPVTFINTFTCNTLFDPASICFEQTTKVGKQLGLSIFTKQTNICSKLRPTLVLFLSVWRTKIPKIWNDLFNNNYLKCTDALISVMWGISSWKSI